MKILIMMIDIRFKNQTHLEERLEIYLKSMFEY
jgi:hypothetical protein